MHHKYISVFEISSKAQTPRVNNLLDISVLVCLHMLALLFEISVYANL